MRLRVFIVGGFLGAGKTTLLRYAARYLRDRGEAVAVITNDQGRTLVDTALCRDDALAVREIPGGCFCCRYDELREALDDARHAGATVALAEAVGSCTDLIATVLAPLERDHRASFELMPLAVVVDPFRVRELGARPPDDDDDLAYLFRKQLEEADLLLLSRADQVTPSVREALTRLAPEVPLLAVSGRTGEGVARWLATRPERLAEPLEVDYQRYARAEARLGWCNATVQVSGAHAPRDLLQRFFARMAQGSADLQAASGRHRTGALAHLKLVSASPPGARGALVRAAAEPALELDALPSRLQESTWLINARIALPPDALAQALQAAMAEAASPAACRWESFEAFAPAPPEPTHRLTHRCGPEAAPDCCL